MLDLNKKFVNFLPHKRFQLTLRLCIQLIYLKLLSNLVIITPTALINLGKSHALDTLLYTQKPELLNILFTVY